MHTLCVRRNQINPNEAQVVIWYSNGVYIVVHRTHRTNRHIWVAVLFRQNRKTKFDGSKKKNAVLVTVCRMARQAKAVWVKISVVHFGSRTAKKECIRQRILIKLFSIILIRINRNTWEMGICGCSWNIRFSLFPFHAQSNRTWNVDAHNCFHSNCSALEVRERKKEDSRLLD